jgi:hypothetical protein
MKQQEVLKAGPSKPSIGFVQPPSPAPKPPPKKEGIKYDMDKPDYSLIPPEALEDVVKILTLGSQKYDRDNWRYVEDGDNRYFAAAQRHMWARHNGQIYDEESGIDHAAHAICCMLFLIAKNKENNKK